jgi:hypothetical protein
VSFRSASRSLLLFCLGAAVVSCGVLHSAAPPNGQSASAQRIFVPGICDFGKVNDFLYRGAQPKAEGVDQLKKFDIDTVVDLRAELHGLIENERQRAVNAFS